MRRITNNNIFKLSASIFYFSFWIFLQTAISTSSFCQTWTMPVDGKVYAGGDKLSGAIVTLFKNGQQQQQIVTTSNGRFSFELPANAEYVISVTKPGYITKKFRINTANVPGDRAEAGGFNQFEPDVTLFEMPTAPEISKRVEAILSQPIAIYQYIPGEKNFGYDQKYTDAIQAKLTELAQLQKQVEKEVEEKAKNAAMEAQKQLEIDKKYKAAIAKGDVALSSKDFASAKTGYNEALVIKPAEIYPKNKLAEIDKQMADAGKQKEINAKYQAAIAKGDGAFGSKDYASAKTAYTEASGLKSSEAYPKTKISEIDKLLAEAGKQKELDAKYQTAISKGDGAFGSKDYSSARSAYTEASGIKPAEAYPKTKIAEIDKILAEMAKAGDMEKQYKELIAKGDNSFTQKDYTSARGSYSNASSLKSSEQYPKTKITECDKLLADIAKQKSGAEREQQYKDAIAKADKLFTSKDYNNSKSAYNEALAVKPAEQYPKTKIAEIDKLLAEAGKQNEINAKYQAAIDKGNNGITAKDYASAKEGFTEALGIKPGEAYPKEKLAEIERLIANAANASAQGNADEKYKATIAKGDKAFMAKDYVTAKPMYTEAIRIKSTEQYPKDKLVEIASLEKNIAEAQEQKEINLQYSQAISKADKLFSQKDYNSSKLAYEDALTYKVNEKHPQDRITLIEDIIRKQTIAQNVKKEPKKTVVVASVVSEEEKVKEYQNELRTKYPNGVTEEEYTNNGKTILRRVVIKNDFAGVYTKVTHNWGGVYCFRDNVPITEIVFENESR
ncbi:MAG: hypothetical protein EPN85_04130 [Bacteroidetes bacterium]|nr:MAG: hypothetical protein EPN85_04130 [Bacteroidota bacterium]